ncbi:helix-turn-helix transcriptional regulator [Geodermatophilus sp. SYSU D00703]
MRRPPRASDNYPGHVIPVLESQAVVRLPLTPAEVERGQRLGALLRRARGERSMLRTALDAGVSPETLRKIESGRVATPAFPTIAAICDVLGLSLDAVWSEVNQSDGGVDLAGVRRDAGAQLAS